VPAMTCLFRHPKTGVYYYRRGVPKALRGAIGKREILRSLGTKDCETAKRLAKPVGIWADALFTSALTRSEPPTMALPPRLDLPFDRAAAEVLRSWFGEGVPELAVSSAKRSSSPPGASLDSVLRKYLVEAAPNQRTSLEYQKTFALFCEISGLTMNSAISVVTKRHVREFKDALLLLPCRMLAKEYRGKSVKEVLALVRGRDDYRRLRPKSINKHLAALSAVFNYAVKHEYREVNPASCMAVRKSREQARVPYDLNDIRRIFGTLLSVREDWKEEEWIPLLALFTGCRMEEIGQLLITDIKEEGGIPFISISGADEQGHIVKRVKTASSVRVVPIHPTLMELGFLCYVALQRAEGAERVFPNLKLHEGKWTIYFSKWWGRQRKRFGILDSRKCFHSFRHAFKDACRAAGVPEDIHDALTGHSNGSVGRSYGNGHSLPVLHQWLSKVTWDVPWLERGRLSSV